MPDDSNLRVKQSEKSVTSDPMTPPPPPEIIISPDLEKLFNDMDKRRDRGVGMVAGSNEIKPPMSMADRVVVGIKNIKENQLVTGDNKRPIDEKSKQDRLSEQWVGSEIGGVVADLENIRISQPACHNTNAMSNDTRDNIDHNQIKCQNMEGGGRPPTPTGIMVWWLE